MISAVRRRCTTINPHLKLTPRSVRQEARTLPQESVYFVLCVMGHYVVSSLVLEQMCVKDKHALFSCNALI